jgi:hypothetical protein
MSAFAGEPQPVEVFHRGAWYAGELLGWRHEDDGRCRVRVRCVVGGLRHSAWVELADLRLPAPAPRPAYRRPPVPPRRSPVPRPGRHRVRDDDTQPHLLLLPPAAPRATGPTGTPEQRPVAPEPVAAAEPVEPVGVR